MQIQPLTPGHSGLEILFDSYIIEDLSSFTELLDLYQTYKKDNPGKTVMVTLDNLLQAEYTSTHASMSNDLDEAEGYDLSGLDPKCFEDGEYLGYLSTPSEFFIRKENFLKQLTGVDFSSACERGLTIDEAEILVLKNVNQSPFKYLDKTIHLKIIPVENAYEGVCGFPNGYFQSDLNPFENYALAKHLSENYGFDLFGIGASLIGFVRNDTLDENQTKNLIADLSRLYSTTENAFDSLFEVITSNKCLFLKYVDYLQM